MFLSSLGLAARCSALNTNQVSRVCGTQFSAVVAGAAKGAAASADQILCGNLKNLNFFVHNYLNS